jgi:hypothetical protein
MDLFGEPMATGAILAAAKLSTREWILAFSSFDVFVTGGGHLDGKRIWLREDSLFF